MAARGLSVDKECDIARHGQASPSNPANVRQLLSIREIFVYFWSRRIIKDRLTDLETYVCIAQWCAPCLTEGKIPPRTLYALVTFSQFQPDPIDDDPSRKQGPRYCGTRTDRRLLLFHRILDNYSFFGKNWCSPGSGIKRRRRKCRRGIFSNSCAVERKSCVRQGAR